jgi:hypothetical protein
VTRPDAIYAGTKREYDRYLRHRGWQAVEVPQINSVDDLKLFAKPRVLALGSYEERDDFEAVASALHQKGGEWAV